MKHALSIFGLIIRKDLRLEFKRAEALISLLGFNILCLILFHFAIDTEPNQYQQIGAGLLWVIFFFMAMLYFNRQTQDDQRYLEGLLLTPTHRDIIYLSKVSFNLLFLLCTQILTLPFFSILFQIDLSNWHTGLLSLFLADLGIAIIGVTVSCMTAHTRLPGFLLPVLMFPILSPVLLASAHIWRILLSEQFIIISLQKWMILMGLFDVVFLVIGSLVFEILVEQ